VIAGTRGKTGAMLLARATAVLGWNQSSLLGVLIFQYLERVPDRRCCGHGYRYHLGMEARYERGIAGNRLSFDEWPLGSSSVARPDRTQAHDCPLPQCSERVYRSPGCCTGNKGKQRHGCECHGDHAPPARYTAVSGAFGQLRAARRGSRQSLRISSAASHSSPYPKASSRAMSS
jgi:hypothetical protein